MFDKHTHPAKMRFCIFSGDTLCGEIHNITDHFSQAVHWDSFFCHPTSFTRATSVARHFNVKVGSAPVEYFTRWRMLLACDRLKNTDNSVALIANALGYESDTAFGKAFNV
ncbi:helix-turn-helix domain-containing protein [Citrobacter amalonaticus]|uniref:helix-turn-helix domain-containing protein n=1 Tax=Citrobacter amalonaticus TaxID=35703 RepID=UPI00255A7A01|nr:AraC family transcriptional regulator [Citrobacter amalonaticus]MDL4617313.1 AraC family transcriptional regulator [Citrobacter amalonaticus]MDL4621411.1 AraC family transcriptional regulator [Citrobacter amalonaticus]